MDSGSTVDERSEKWTTAASTPQKRDNTTNLAEGQITSSSCRLFEKKALLQNE